MLDDVILVTVNGAKMRGIRAVSAVAVNEPSVLIR